MKKLIEFSPENFLNDQGLICSLHCFVKYTNLSPIGISGRGKIGSGRVGFYDL